MIRVAVIGAGRVARTHVDVLRRTPGVQVVAVADPRSDAARVLASEVGVQAFVSLSEVLASMPLDAVDIIAPHHVHHSLALEALTAGVHVFMDKPIATDVGQARELCEMAAREQLVLAVCHNLLFHPALSRATELVESGLLGRVTHAQATSAGWLDLSPWDFRLDPEATGGGAWVDGAPHLVYLLEAFLGPAVQLRALLSRTESRLGGEDTAVGQALFESGAVASICVGYSDCPAGPQDAWPQGWRLGLGLVGTDGRLDLDLLPSAQVSWHRKGEPAQVEDLAHVPFDVGFQGALADFVAAVNGTTPLRVSPLDSLRNLELIRSALQG